MRKLLTVLLVGTLVTGCGGEKNKAESRQKKEAESSESAGPRPLRNTEAVKMMADARQIWMALYVANTDNQAVNEDPLWPKSGEYKSSTEFFKAAVGGGWLSGMPPSMFSAPGLDVCKDADFSSFSQNHNAWCMALDWDEDASPNIPLFFTRNIKFDAKMDGDPSLSLQDVVGVEPEADGLGGGYAVWITGAGQVFAVKAADFSREKFLVDFEEKNSFLRP